MNQSDIDDLSQVTAEVVHSYFERMVAPMIERNHALELRLAVLEKAPAPDFSLHVQDALAPLVKRNAELEARIKELESRPVAKDGKDGAHMVNAIQDQDGVLILTLSDGKTVPAGKVKGRDGKDVDLAAVSRLIDDAVAKAVAALPKPKDGDDGKSVTVDDVRPVLRELVDALPKPQDGKDADPAVISRLVDDAVAKAVAALPKPQDGKSVTIDDLRPVLREMVDALPPAAPGKDADPALIKQMVADAVSAIPVPKDGSSVTIDDVRPLVETAVAKAVSDLPKPKDGDPGASVTIEDVRPVLREMVDAIPRPKDGESVTVDQIEPLVQDTVAKAVAALPKPADGKSVSIEDVRPVIEAAVAKAVSDIPTPKDGKDADPADIAKRLIPEVERAVAQLPRPVDVVGADIDKDGNLIIRKSDGSTDNLGRIVGSDGAGFDNIEAIEDDLTFGVRFGRGAAAKELRWAKATLADADQGVWKDGEYKRGQAATFGGSYWLAKRDTSSKPGTDDSWRLIVKRGQDGKDRK